MHVTTRSGALARRPRRRRTPLFGTPRPEMLNRKPIIIVGFARSGSNILMNLLRSHPNVCTPRGETQQVFYENSRAHLLGRFDNRVIRNLSRIKYLPILMVEHMDILSQDIWRPRPPLKEFTRRYIDRKLYKDKLKSTAPDCNMFKAENIRYTRRELAASRLLLKNLNGLIYLSREFADMYPDAVFFGLVRNGFAVCESHMRRGWDLKTIASQYDEGCRQMIRDAAEIHNFHFIKFEDLLNEPLETMKRAYQLAGLNFAQVDKVRMSDKPVISQSGKHEQVRSAESGDGSGRYRPVYWTPPDQLQTYIVGGVNENQMRLLSPEHKKLILNQCRMPLEHFGYA